MPDNPRRPGCDAGTFQLADNPHNAIVQLVQERRTGRGPLSGVPIVVKDLIDVAGVPTRCGSTVLADEKKR